MADFTGKYKQVSSNNFDALMKELGASDEVAAALKNQMQDLEFSKNGNVFTQKSISPQRTQEIQFELGKEFDEKRHDGRTVKSVVVLDGNKFVKTTVDKEKGKELKVVSEFNGNELKVTATSGAVVATGVYTKQ
ncbi:unnamed protein product [Medioppia subpectinata]|uniref:Uncharacterized protein n=1 Tax=Medioppia subpectinata TaxID=1979941 RepID=A0A7R9L2I5_9ACAR|nr:unnamed protein product [Medioppia subpectinata]CAG2113124.1 unnamed protein product [Medioppia subpectinata]